MATNTLITADEFEVTSARLGPCELVRGEVMPLSPGGYEHSRISIKVAFALERWAVDSGLGRVIGNEAGLIVESSPDTIRGADVAYLSYQRLPKGAEPTGFFKTPPELVVVILGKGQNWRDMVEKAGEYLSMGVDRGWVMNPETRRVHVFRSDAEPAILGDDNLLADESILPGFSCSINSLFTD